MPERIILVVCLSNLSRIKKYLFLKNLRDEELHHFYAFIIACWNTKNVNASTSNLNMKYFCICLRF